MQTKVKWLLQDVGISNIAVEDSFEHQIETHSHTVWEQSEGVSLITDLSLSKKT